MIISGFPDTASTVVFFRLADLSKRQLRETDSPNWNERTNFLLCLQQGVSGSTPRRN